MQEDGMNPNDVPWQRPSTMRYNPPPNWPAAPQGWTPPPGWQPDPSWPLPPLGWQLWTDVTSMNTPAPGYPPPFVSQPVINHDLATNSSKPATRKWWLLAIPLAVLLLVTAVLSIGGGVGANGPDDKHYAVGDRMDEGYYCGSVDSKGTPDLPGAQHFAVGRNSSFLASGNCANYVGFFTSFIAANLSAHNYSGSILFDGEVVTQYGKVYNFKDVGGYDHPYGNLDGFAVPF